MEVTHSREQSNERWLFSIPGARGKGAGSSAVPRRGRHRAGLASAPKDGAARTVV